MNDEESGRSQKEENSQSLENQQTAETAENSLASEPKPYTGPDRRTRDDIREQIGDEKILDEEERKTVLQRLKDGVFKWRENDDLRHALGGDETVYSEEQRQSILQFVATSIKTFVKIGIDRPKQEEEKKKRFAEMVREQDRNRDRLRQHERDR